MPLHSRKGLGYHCHCVGLVLRIHSTKQNLSAWLSDWNIETTPLSPFGPLLSFHSLSVSVSLCVCALCVHLCVCVCACECVCFHLSVHTWHPEADAECHPAVHLTLLLCQGHPLTWLTRAGQQSPRMVPAFCCPSAGVTDVFIWCCDPSSCPHACAASAPLTALALPPSIGQRGQCRLSFVWPIESAVFLGFLPLISNSGFVW